MRKIRLLNFLLTFSLIMGAHLFAQELNMPSDTTPTAEMSAEEQRHFKAVAGLLRCPTCTGLSVLDSDAPFSLQIQALVKEKIKQGLTEEEIFSYFTERYGPWILREPPKTGFNIFAWVIPIALLLLGPLLVWFMVWRQPKQESVPGRSTEELLEEFEALLAQARQVRNS